jgi:cystathionine beta-lyase/cystathionine gamma-synthase
VRIAHQCESALAIATFLSSHKQVTAVHYPGLAAYPQHALAVKQMRKFGSVLSFEIAGGKDAARKILDALEIVRPAVSFGGPETLICHPASSTHIGVDTDAQIASGITDSMLRLSIGLEATSDIIADLQNALK